MEILSGDLGYLMRCFQHFFHEMWNPDQFFDQGLSGLVGEEAQLSANSKGKKEEDDQLSDKGLGGSYANLRACMGVDHMVRLSCQTRLHRITNG